MIPNTLKNSSTDDAPYLGKIGEGDEWHDCYQFGKNPLVYAVVQQNTAVVDALLSRKDLNINQHSAVQTEKANSCDLLTLAYHRGGKNPEILRSLLLHDDINIDDTTLMATIDASASKESVPTPLKKVLKSRQLLVEAYKNHESGSFSRMITQSYQLCPLVIYNRVVNMIAKFDEQKVAQDDNESTIKKEDCELIAALLNPCVVDELFKDLARQLGTFIYNNNDLFAPEAFELAILFLQHAQHDQRLLISSLFQLAGAKDQPGEQRSLDELIADPDTRASILRALAKANLYRLNASDDLPKMTEQFVQTRFRQHPESLSLMWNIVRLYNATHDLEGQADEETVTKIVEFFEAFIAQQNKAQNKQPAAPSTEGSLLRRSLSGVLAATAESATSPRGALASTRT